MQYVTCEWLHGCNNVSVATVTHPTVGDVEICQGHLDWLMEDMTDGRPNPTKMVPPIAAKHARRIDIAVLVAENAENDDRAYKLDKLNREG